MFLHVVFSQTRALFRPRLARTFQTSQWASPSMVSPRSMAIEWLLKTSTFPSMRAMSPHCLVTMALARPPPCMCATTVFSVFFPRSASLDEYKCSLTIYIVCVVSLKFDLCIPFNLLNRPLLTGRLFCSILALKMQRGRD